MELTDKELQERLENEREYQTRLRLNHAISPLDNPHKIEASRRTVAQLLTELNRRIRQQGNKEVTKQGAPKTEETKTENSKKEEKKTEASKAEASKAEGSKAEKSKPEKSKTEKQKAEKSE